MTLVEQRCEPIIAGSPPLSRGEADSLHQQIPAWTLNDKELIREFKFKDFRQAMIFVDRIAGIANEQDHHPDIQISYNTVRLSLSTHKIDGLSMNDFILAAKIDAGSDRRMSGKAA